MTLEAFTLDGLSLSNGSPFEVADTPEFTPAPMRADWVGGPDTDGAILLEDPHADNSVFTIPLRVSQQTTADLAAGYLGQLLDKLGAASRNGSTGIDLVWTPKDWTKSFTATVLLGEVAGLPLDSRGAVMGWLVRSPVITVRLTCKPFLYGDWMDTITDAFGSNTIANYTLDAGAGTLSISGGVLVPSSTADKYLIHTSSPYAMENARVTAKVTTGASVASGIAGVALKRLDATNMLFGQVTFAGASSVVRIAKIDAGSISTLASSSVFTPTAATSYWVRARQEGNLVTAEVFTSAPTALSVATRSIAFTLTGGDITKFGTGVTGRAGIRLNPQATDWRMDDLTIEPNVFVSTAAAMEFIVSDVVGDAFAEGKLTLTDSATQARRHAEVGIEEDYTTSASSFIAKASLVTSGFAGIPATLTLQSTAAFGTGVLTHIGAWRVKLLGAQVSTTGVQVRLAYRTGDGQYSFTPWITPPLAALECEIDFGIIQIGEVERGTQAWDGRVEAISTTVGDTLSLPNAGAGLLMMPADRYMKVRAPYVYKAGVLVARDEFTGRAAALALNTLVAPLGGTWATSGVATDFVAADAPLSTDETMARSVATTEASARFAILGSTNYIDSEVGLSHYRTLAYYYDSAVIARWVDSSNYLRFKLGIFGIDLRALVAGSVVASSTASFMPQAATWYGLRVVVFASGTAFGTLLDATGSPIQTLRIQHSSLATGGALATGKPGFSDQSILGGLANSRYYDNFYGATPAAEPLVLESGRTVVLSHQSTLKESSAGGVYGSLQPRGARIYLPQAGRDDRQARVVAKVRRNDVDTTSDTALSDSLTAQMSYRPRFRIPRS
jgi:hypothetical protein